MGRHPLPTLAVRDTKAAAMLDLKPQEFRDMVKGGHLPGPVKLHGNIERWRVSDLEAILSGQAARPDPDDDIDI